MGTQFILGIILGFSGGVAVSVVAGFIVLIIIAAKRDEEIEKRREAL